MGRTGPPFFIVGSARSGTTLLRLIFNAHHEIAVPPESRFITELYQGGRARPDAGPDKDEDAVDPQVFLGKLAAHPRWPEWHLPIEAVAEELPDNAKLSYAAAITCAFNAYAHAHGKQRWGDKTPRYIEQIDLLAHLFPEARFIHLVRDGRDVALSYAHVPFGPKTVGAAAELWARRVQAGLGGGRPLGAERYTEIRYEDLVEDATGTVKELCRFVGVAFDPGMLDYTDRDPDAVLPRASKYNPKVTEPPRKKDRSWKDDMAPKDVEAFEAVAGDTLSRLGYERSFESPGLRAKLVGNLGRRGLPIGRLKP